MFEADISDATVMALFLLPANLDKLRDKFLTTLRPGTRIVANTFWIDGWQPEQVVELPDSECSNWCRAMLFIVPARVEGTWRLPQGELSIKQSFQTIAGTLTNGGRAAPIENGKLNGDQISFTAGGAQYTGRVNGTRMEGTASPGGAWSATRAN
jgi:hypothetical protein